MSVILVYQPSDLSADDFYALDEECFPDEPIGRGFGISFTESPFWLALVDGRPAGYGFLKAMPEYAWIARIGVVPEERNRGIGGRLMDAMLQYCREIQKLTVILYVRQDNPSAVHLYEKHGFHISEVSYQYIVSTDPLLNDAYPFDVSALDAIPITEVPEKERPVFSVQWSHLPELHDPPKTYVLLFYVDGTRQVGYCRLSPGFPGCFPFELLSPARQLAGALAGLKPYLSKEQNILKLTFANPDMAEACDALGFRLNYSLYRMMVDLGGESNSPRGVEKLRR